MDVLITWNDDSELIGRCVNVGCPAQEVGGRFQVNADFWYPVREQLREIHGQNLVVVGIPERQLVGPDWKQMQGIK